MRVVELDGDVRNGRERRPRLPRRPAGPPAHVGLRRRAEREQPVAKELGLRATACRAASRPAPSRRERPAILAVDPRPARAAAHEGALRGEQRAALATPRSGSTSQRVPAPSRSFVARSGSARGDVRRERLAARRERCEAQSPRPPRASARGSSVTPLAATKPSSRRRSRPATPGCMRVDDGDELAGHDPQRPPHAEHAHERALLVERALEVADLERSASAPTPRGTRSPGRWSGARRPTEPPRAGPRRAPRAPGGAGARGAAAAPRRSSVAWRSSTLA